MKLSTTQPSKIEIDEIFEKNIINLEPLASNYFKEVIRIPGDASTRIYYRLLGKNNSSYILMRLEQPFDNLSAGFPFLAVQRHMRKMGVDVPEVLVESPSLGYILLEDLGDTTLLRKLQEVSSPDIERHLYEEMLDRLAEFHFKCTPGYGTPISEKQNLEGFNLYFNEEKLMWELNFMIEHFYQKYLSRNFPDEVLVKIRSDFAQICRELASEPMVFTHRDFHSRNIMSDCKNSDRWVMIDFQDARLGCKQYDLASLLMDSYYQLDTNQVDRLINYYISKWESLSGERVDSLHFRRIFDLMSIQRNLKAIGSFASFLNRRGNPGYLKYIGNTFENVRRTLLKYPEFTQLREVLFHYYYF